MRKILLSALLASPLVAFAAPPNLVSNGSFEANAVPPLSFFILNNGAVPGWTLNSQLEIRNNAVGTAQDGVNFAELDAYSNNSISQVLSTVASTTYDLSFYYSNRTGTSLATNGLSYDIGAGAVILPALALNNTGNNVWSLFTVSFTASSASTTLTLTGLGISDSYGSSLDNVSVTASAVPEPETYALMLAGLVALGFVARRRRVQA